MDELRSQPPSKKPVVVRLNEQDQKKLENLADFWGLPMSGAMRRLIREAEVTKPEEVAV